MERRLVFRDAVERRDEPGNRVPFRRPRAVRWRAAHRCMLPEGTLLGDADTIVRELAVLELVVAAFGDEILDILEQIGVTIHECLRTDAIQFLISIGDEHNVAIEGDAAALEGDHRHEVDDALALHVERAAAPDVTVLEHSRKRIDTPVAGVRWDDVHVVHQCDRLLAAVALEARIQVGASSRR